MTDHRRLACEGRDDLFFPEDDDYDTKYTRKARYLCSMCPIRIKCRDKGIDNQEPYGIWGGLTPAEREALYVG